jgi:hypothetical protein
MSLSIVIKFCFRGDHIVPNFEEIWPSKKGAKAERPKKGLEYYYDAMLNGPSLSGKLRYSHGNISTKARIFTIKIHTFI